MAMLNNNTVEGAVLEATDHVLKQHVKGSLSEQAAVLKLIDVFKAAELYLLARDAAKSAQEDKEEATREMTRACKTAEKLEEELKVRFGKLCEATGWGD